MRQITNLICLIMLVHFNYCVHTHVCNDTHFSLSVQRKIIQTVSSVSNVSRKKTKEFGNAKSTTRIRTERPLYFKIKSWLTWLMWSWNFLYPCPKMEKNFRFALGEMETKEHLNRRSRNRTETVLGNFCIWLSLQEPITAIA